MGGRKETNDREYCICACVCMCVSVCRYVCCIMEGRAGREGGGGRGGGGGGGWEAGRS